MKTDTVKTNLN